jgi:hypothetical protein
MKELQESIFPNLDKILDQKHISQKELNIRLGISEKSLWNKKRGRTEFTLEEVEKICEMIPEYRLEYIFKRVSNQ